MPQVTSITVNDGATPPVSHVFAIQDRDGGKTVFRDSAGQSVRGCNVFAHTALLAKTSVAANRNIVSLSSPVEVTTPTGAVQVESVSNFKFEANFASGLTKEQRTAKLVLFLNLLAQADVKANMVDISPLS